MNRKNLYENKNRTKKKKSNIYANNKYIVLRERKKKGQTTAQAIDIIKLKTLT